MSQSSSHDDHEVVYVAVGRNFEEGKLSLIFAIEEFPNTKICILHVHQPGKIIPLQGTDNLPVSKLDQHQIRQIHELERDVVAKILDDYLLFCHQSEKVLQINSMDYEIWGSVLKVQAEKLCMELDDIAQGIVELAYEHNIKKLVMGAAADSYYSEEMMSVRSRKAKYVRQRVPVYCQIRFICKGYFICNGEDEFARLSNDVYGSTSSAANRDIEFDELQLQEEDDHEQENIDQLCTQLDLAMAEAEKCRREALEETLRRGEAERTAAKYIRKTEALQSLYKKELLQRKEAELALSKEKEEHQRTKNQREEDRIVAMDQQLLMQIKVNSSNTTIEQLEDEKFCALEQCKELTQGLSKLQEELEIARQSYAELNNAGMNREKFLPVFSLSEIEEATEDFSRSLKIEESRYWSIYKGFLRHTVVSIKVLNHDDMREFEYEVNNLQQLRHPHIISLIGTCSERCIMIREHLPNGSLEDRLRCKDNTPALPWQTRIRIATDLCSTLIFLHSCTPDSIVHGHLTPRLIFLDENFTCKIGEFGMCRTISLPESSSRASSSDRNYDIPYVDPRFHVTGELSPKSDTYSFGIILLQLLTGRLSVSNIVEEIRHCIDAGDFDSILDPTAGDWPVDQAKQLAQLALRCCAINQSSRPDLASEPWRTLAPIRASCGSPATSSLSDLPNDQQPPSYFICPITQDVMEDPHVAADGNTYEKRALLEWTSRRNASPLTNEPFPHLNLIPNHPLRSAIQDWLQQNNSNHST